MPIRITYRITAQHTSDAEAKLLKIAYEQSVELPDDVLSPEIRENNVGKPGELKPVSDQLWESEIVYPEENAGDEISQFLNILFGNVSMFSGVMVAGLDWASAKSPKLPGPVFGVDGVRKKLGITQRRALSCTALKPVGLSADALAQLAAEFAEGGIDIIKDDHGLANQKSAPFQDRLQKCTDAVRKANDKTGFNSVYCPNITADGSETLHRYEQAWKAGAGAVLVSPHLTGLSVLAELAASEIPLPVMAHPAFSGALVQNPSHGFTKAFLYGDVWRALGADFSIYPNAGGRFSFSEETCLAVNDRCRTNDLPFKPVFPTPGGGMQRQTIPALLESYGPDTVFLVGGSLYQHPNGIIYASKEIREILAG